MAYQHASSWTERTGSQNERHARSQGFRNAHTSLGVAGHLVHMGAMLFPVLAAELITDAAKYRKAVRIGSVATTVLYEGLYTAREAHRRERQEEKLSHCRSRE